MLEKYLKYAKLRLWKFYRQQKGMERLKALDAYLVLNAQDLDSELAFELRKVAQRFNKFFVLAKKAFVLSFLQQYDQQLINLEEFMYVGDLSRENLEIWEGGWKLEWMYFLRGLFLQDAIDSNTWYIVDKLSLKIFSDKHSSFYQKLRESLRSKNSQLIAI